MQPPTADIPKTQDPALPTNPAYERLTARALDLFGQLRQVTADQVHDLLRTEHPDILAQDLARLRIEMLRLDPPYAKGTIAQYASALRVLARNLGNPIPCAPPPPRRRAASSRDHWRWMEGAAHRWPSLPVAATLCGLDDVELIAEALEALAEKQRGKAKQTLLTAAREARRLGEDDA